jgi:DNA-binding IclR family transcriptional regulator
MPETSKTADHALALLTAVSEHQPVTAGELCRLLAMNRTIAARLLATLHQRGFVRRVGAEYTLGPAAIRLAHQVEPALRGAALPVMRRLCAEVGETVVLQVIDGDQVVILEQVIASHHVVRVEHNLIARHPLPFGASGRVLLAFGPPRTVGRFLAQPGGTAGAAAGLAAELDRVREAGYATSHDELQWGVHGAAAPVLAADGSLLAALTLLVPVNRAGQLAGHIAPLVKAARQIRP